MGIEALLGIVASVIVPTLGGVAWINERSNRRIDKMLEKNDQQLGIVLSHMEKVEDALGHIRSELPLRYTLREDHLRLAERVNRLEINCQRHFLEDNTG